MWNYDKFIKDKEITDNYCFSTNNFIERCNRTLNENLIFKKSSFVNFWNSILDTDIYFKHKKEV